MCLTIEGCFGFQNQMEYVKLAVKGLGLTVKNKNSPHAASGQLNCKITWPFLTFQQIKTYMNGLLNLRGKFFPCFLHVTRSYNTCYEFLTSF